MRRTAASPAVVPLERQRHALLRQLGLLDAASDSALDALTETAAVITAAPMALVSLIDGDRLTFKSRVGLALEQSTRHRSFCADAIQTPALLLVGDATRDLRFAEHALVVGEPHVRFYAGQPLCVAGICIGTLCVFGTQAMVLSDAAKAGLRCLGAAVEALLTERQRGLAATGRHRRLTDVATVSDDGRWETDAGTARDKRPAIAAEQARRSAVALLADLSAQVPGLIFQLHRDVGGGMSFPYVSEHIHAVYELDAADVLIDAAPAMARWHPDDAPRLQTSLQQSAHDLSPWRETFRVVLPLRGERVLSGHAKPMRLPDGGVLWHGLLTDVTEQVEEAEKMQSLGLANAAAEKVAQLRREFMSRVSHELRTPLNAVLGFAQLLRLNGGTQPRVEILQSATQIVHAGGHLLSLIDDLLDLASLDAGRLELQLEPLTLAPLVRRCVSLIEAHAIAQHMSLMVTADSELPTVLGDARAVKQVLFNLLGNAIKFGRPHTTVRVVLAHEAALGRVSMTVTDQGHGIDADKLDAIFEPFMRVHSGAHAPVGSGLGLAISQKLVAAMDGQIAVTSEPGRGTVFTVHLRVDGRPAPPMTLASGFADLSELPSSRMASATDGPLQAPSALARVLYVEDDPVNGLLMQEFFKASSATATLDIVESGLDALRMAALSKPDLILLDMNLPDLDGAGVMLRLRADPRTAQIPVIAVSADAMAEHISEARRVGFDGYWTKPVDIRLVHAEIERRFGRQLPRMTL